MQKITYIRFCFWRNYSAKVFDHDSDGLHATKYRYDELQLESSLTTNVSSSVPTADLHVDKAQLTSKLFIRVVRLTFNSCVETNPLFVC